MTSTDKARQALVTAGSAKGSPMSTMLALLGKESMKEQFAVALPMHLKANADRYIIHDTTTAGSEAARLLAGIPAWGDAYRDSAGT